MPYSLVRSKYACEVYWNPWSLWSCNSGDFLFLQTHRKMDGIQYKIDCLAGTGLVNDNASVIQITDHGQIENAFLGMNVRNVCDPLLIWMCSIEFTIQKVLVFVDLPAHLDPFSSAAYLT